MAKTDTKKYTELLSRFVTLTHEEPYDRDAYLEWIREAGKHYRLEKAMTEFYMSPVLEEAGEGETFCDYDTGKGEKVLTRLRIVSRNKAVIIGTMYTRADDPGRSDEEIDQLNTILRITMGFVSRLRLLRMVEEYGFHDTEGYYNFRAFARYLVNLNLENRLGGKIAFHIDLHNFGMVNQEVGRFYGDMILMNFYRMLLNTIGDYGIAIRLGGDKFVGIFDGKIKGAVFDLFNSATVPYGDMAMPGETGKLYEPFHPDLRRNVSFGAPVPGASGEFGDKRINISAAAGIFIIPDTFKMKTPGDIMDKLMLAGNVAKSSSENTIVFYDDRMSMNRDHVQKIQAEFRIALKTEEFQVYYQPKVDISSRKIIGAEALCRWLKNGIIVPPMEFIPILEINTAICDLDFYMLAHVCRDIRRWLDEGRDVVRISVNFSRKHLVDVNLLPHIMEIVDHYRVPHEYIEIELTETTTDVTFRDLKRVAQELQNRGIWTAVDDFGMGYSSLNLLREIPWNVLKVDKNFVPKDSEEESSVSNMMFKHVTSLARDMGLECVIEGVETPTQLDILRRNNCNIVQGFIFDRPLPHAEFQQRLDRKFYPE